MGSFSNYINKKGTTVNSSSNSSFMTYHNKREKEREEEEKRKQEELKKQEEKQAEENKKETLPKASETKKLQITTSPTEQVAIREKYNNLTPAGKLKLYESSLGDNDKVLRDIDKDSNLYDIKYLEAEINPDKYFIKPSQAFKDGYQFGDIHRTAGATIGDIGTNFIKGVVGVGQGAGKFLASGVAQIADWVGKDEYANKVRKKIADNPNPTTGWIEKNIEKPIDKNSVSGNKTDKVVENIGQMAGYWAAGEVAGGLAESSGLGAEKVEKIGRIVSDASMFTSAAGDSFSESYSKENVKDWQAWTKAVGSGGIEVATERMFGLFGTSGLDTDLANTVSDQISSGVGKALARNGIQATGEAIEEFLSYLGNQGLDILIDSLDKVSGGNGAKFHQNWNWEDVGEQMGMAFLSSFLIGGGTNISSIIENKTNSNTWTDAINETARQQDTAGQIENLSNEIEKIDKRIAKETDSNKINELNNEYNWKQKQLNALTLPTANQENLYSNKLKQQATEEINNSNAPEVDKKTMLEALDKIDNVTDADIEAIRQTIEAYNQEVELEGNKLETAGDYKNDQTRRQKYMQYKNDTSEYDSTVVNEVLDTIPQNRNGRRTVKQWLQAADEIGKRIANLSNEEIEKIAYKSWFELEPTKNITQYDNVTKQNVGFQKFTSDEWINTINDAVNNARTNYNLPEEISIKDYQGREIDHEIHTYSTDAYDGQINMVKEFQDEDGNTIAKIVYNYFDNEINVDLIETEPEYRRKGLATRLLQDLQKDAKAEGMKINYGYTSEDGTKLLNAVNEARENNKINNEINSFKNAKNTVPRNVIEKISDNIKIPLKEGAEYVYNTEISKKAGNNENPKVTNIDNIFSGITKNNIKNFRKKAIEKALSLFRNKTITIKDTQTVAEINKSGIKETYSKDLTESKIQSANNLNDIIAEGIYKYTTRDIESKDGVLYHNFFSPVSYNGENQIMRVVIKEYTQNDTMKDKFYYHSLELLDNIENGSDSFLPRQSGSKTVESLPSNNSIPQLTKNVKSDTTINNNYMHKNENNENTPGETINWNKIERPEGKFRKHYQSIIQSSNTTAEAKAIAKEMMGLDTYVPQSNTELLKKADSRISTTNADSELNSLYSKVLNNEKVSDVDIAVGERLIEYYSKIGDAAKLQDAIHTTAMAGTQAGRTVQALALLNHMTPQGQLVWLDRSITKANNELQQRYKNKENIPQFELTEDMQNKILNTETQEEMYKALDDVYEELGEQVPKTFREQIDEWRYFSMLANVKTHARNVIGNVAMGMTQRLKNKVAGAIEDVLFRNDYEIERTHTLKRTSKKTKNFAKIDVQNMDVQTQLGMNENKYNPQSRLQNARKTFKSDILNNTLGKMFDINSKALEIEDNIGLKAAYVNSLGNYITANNIDVDNITDAQLAKGRQHAIREAQEATFHQASALATALNQLGNKNNAAKFALDATVPFKKTPINIAKTGIEYSPVGLIKAAVYDIKNVRNGNITINQYIDNISKGLTGTGLAFIGYVLSEAGILKASGGDDDKKENYDKEQGKQQYAITIGGKTVSLDWLSPVGIPIFIGAEINQQFNKTKKENTSKSTDDDEILNRVIQKIGDIGTAFSNAAQPMSEMSMISGLTTVLSSYNRENAAANMFSNSVKSYINQFLPTAVKQVARTTDKYERTTKSTKTGTLPKAIDTTINQIKSGIPGLRQTLPTKTNIWGENVKQSENIITRAFNNFINPATVKDISTDKVDQELNSLYDKTLESSIIPKAIDKKLAIDNQNYILTNEEYAKYNQLYGKTSYNILNNLVNSSTYKKLNDTQKQQAIEKVYSYAKEQVKIDYAKQNKLDYEETALSRTVNALKKSNGNLSDYFEYTSKIENTDKDSDKIRTLLNSKYSKNTKKAIYENTLGNNDSKYQLLKTANIDIDKYLEFTNQEFVADRKDDGTVSGQAISGSKKAKVLNYINNMQGLTYTQKLLLYGYGADYKLSDEERKYVFNYVKSLNKTEKEKQEIISHFKGFTIYKNGKIEY